MTDEARERRRRLDHARYMRERDIRLKRQKQYYREHYDQCRDSIRRCQMRKQQAKLRALYKAGAPFFYYQGL